MKLAKKIIVLILAFESRIILAKYKPFVIAVTGSVGKTSTKDAIYSMVKNHGHFVRKSEKSLNSEIGLPLTIIGVPNAWHSFSGWLDNIVVGLKLILRKSEYPDMLVLEVGADHPGDIKKVTKWLRPNIAVMTKISDTPVHVEFFNNPEQVFAEKMELAKAVSADGNVVVFGDDEKVSSVRQAVKSNNPTVTTFGMNEDVDVRAFDYEIIGLNEGFTFKINLPGRTETVKVMGIIGRQQIYPLLAATAVGKLRGIAPEDILRGLYDYEPPKGRMNVITGVNDCVIIDDTYNSSPDAALSALSALKDAKCSGKRVAVLGDMMELGKYSGEEHRRVGRAVIGSADMLVTVGPRSRAMAEAATEAGMDPSMVKSFDSSADVVKAIATFVTAGDVILVKGSQSVRMEKIVKELLKDQSKADKLLIRQESEWLKKG